MFREIYKSTLTGLSLTAATALLAQSGHDHSAHAPSTTAAPAPTAAAPAPCPNTPASPPAELAGWGSPLPVTAAKEGKGLASATITPDRAATVALAPASSIRYRLPPEKPLDPSSQGGLLAFEIAAAGKYRIALGGRGWIDVVNGKAAQTSIAHGHGPACTGIAKMVDFDLKPGRYLLQLSGSQNPALTVMIASLP